MALTNNSRVKFIEVPTLTKYNQYTEKEGGMFFVKDIKKIIVDGVQYGTNTDDIKAETGPILTTLGLHAGRIQTNESSISTINDSLTSMTTAIGKKIETSRIGQANGVAGLDASGHVPSSQLPGYVDDVAEFANRAAFPASGETGKIYVAKDTNIIYRWGGTDYVIISSTLALGTTSSSAFRGDYGLAAYNHSNQTTGNPHAVNKSHLGLSAVDDTSDMNKPVSTAQGLAINQAKTDSMNYTDSGVGGVYTHLTDTYETKANLVANYATKNYAEGMSAKWVVVA